LENGKGSAGRQSYREIVFGPRKGKRKGEASTSGEWVKGGAN